MPYAAAGRAHVVVGGESGERVRRLNEGQTGELRDLRRGCVRVKRGAVDELELLPVAQVTNTVALLAESKASVEFVGEINEQQYREAMKGRE